MPRSFWPHHPRADSEAHFSSKTDRSISLVGVPCFAFVRDDVPLPKRCATRASSCRPTNRAYGTRSGSSQSTSGMRNGSSRAPPSCTRAALTHSSYRGCIVTSSRGRHALDVLRTASSIGVSADRQTAERFHRRHRWPQLPRADRATSEPDLLGIALSLGTPRGPAGAGAPSRHQVERMITEGRSNHSQPTTKASPLRHRLAVILPRASRRVEEWARDL